MIGFFPIIERMLMRVFNWELLESNNHFIVGLGRHHARPLEGYNNQFKKLYFR